MRVIGLHLRITHSLQETAKKAASFDLPFFQCFLFVQNSTTLLRLTSTEIIDFVTFRRKHFTQLYAHGSYLINLSSVDHIVHSALDYELRLARRLEFTHLILHPGSVKKTETKERGIDAAARALNKALKQHPNITVLLENIAHGGINIGNELEDLAAIYEKLDTPERVGFCLDTAHAHAYGYDIVSEQGRQDFINRVDSLLGLSRIALLHINDTHEAFGSRQDRHQKLGQGILGTDVLRSFIQDPRLAHIPLLTEPPMISEQEEYEQLELLRSMA